MNFHAIACWNFPIPFAKSAGTIGSLGNPSSLVGFALTLTPAFPAASAKIRNTRPFVGSIGLEQPKQPLCAKRYVSELR